jgi:hypothetical protein
VKKIRFLKALGVALASILIVSGALWATSNTWSYPVPTLGGLVANDLIYAKDASHLSNITGLTLGSTSGGSITLNSRTFLNTTGTIYGFQTKPAAGAAGASVTGAEFSPRFLATFGGVNLIGIQVDPILKAGAGTLTGDFRGIEVNIGDEYSSSRTVSGRTAAIQIYHGFNGTLTGGSFGIAMDAAGGSKPYTAAFRFDVQAGLAGATGGTTSVASVCGGGYIRAQIASVVGYIPVCVSP